VKFFTVAQCPHIEGMSIDDLVNFSSQYHLEAYIPGPIRGGKPPRLDCYWLLAVSSASKDLKDNAMYDTQRQGFLCIEENFHHREKISDIKMD
jgi:hypothetical protein